MEQCDVLIVGAGPAGSTCGGLLSENGLAVLIIDRERFPRDKPCAGWITPAVFQTLRIDPREYQKERLLQGIRQFRTGVIYRSEIVTDYDQTVSYGIRRAEFDHFLLQRSNVPALLGEPVKSLERVADGWVANGRIKARLVIGAGGHSCPVARALGAVAGKEAAIVAMVAEFEMNETQAWHCSIPAGSVSLSFTKEMNGYGWLFRKGRYLNVGLGALDGKDIRLRTTAFCRHLRKGGDLPADVEGRLKGHAYLPYRSKGGRAIVGHRALLIGDAAGLSFPESGEGILPAIESGIIAARTVIAASGDYRPEKLQPYAAEVAARFGANGGGEVPIPAGVKELGGSAILSSKWLTRHLVLDRWFLHRRMPMLEE